MPAILFYLLICVAIVLAIPLAVFVVAAALAVAFVLAVAGWIASAMAPRDRRRRDGLVIETEYTVLSEPAPVRRRRPPADRG